MEASWRRRWGETSAATYRCEQQLSHIQLHDDTSDGPHVALHVPAQPQDDLGGAVLSGVDHRAVVLVLERRSTKVDDW